MGRLRPQEMAALLEEVRLLNQEAAKAKRARR
jgi:hypothetical protein